MKPRGTRELGSDNAGVSRYLISNQAGVGMMGGKEYMCWLPIDKLDEYKEFPTFFREKLTNLGNEIEHIVSDERMTKF